MVRVEGDGGSMKRDEMVLNETSLSECVCALEEGSAAVQKGCWMDGFFLDGGWEEEIKE